MSNTLSTLPVITIHRILDELPTCDILTSLSCVNQRLRAICLDYHRFQFDFICSFNAKGRQFDKKCAQLLRLSSQVVSLTLANGHDATIPMGNSYFFSQVMSTHPNFCNLRSLNLNYVDSDIRQSFKMHRSSFAALTSISISFIQNEEMITPVFVSNAVNELLLYSSLLVHLTVKSYNFPPDQVIIASNQTLTTSSITHLALYNIEIDLKTLLPMTPFLRSLISSAYSNPIVDNICLLPPIHLQRLSITVEGIDLTTIERLLASMIHLSHFTLIAQEVDKEWADGDQWAQLLSTVTTFTFSFAFEFGAFQEEPFHLQLFQTNFWLIEKKWYVTFDSCIHAFQSLLYSNPYCLDEYPFNAMRDSFVTQSTCPEGTSFPHVTGLDTTDWLSMNTTLLRRCTHLNELFIGAARLQCSLHWPDIIAALNTTRITSVSLDTIAMTTSISASVQLLKNLPSLRSLRVSVSLLKMLLDYDWPNITELDIVWGSDRLPKLLDQQQLDSLCRSFTRVQHLSFTRSFIDNVAQLLNSMMLTLSHVYIQHPSTITRDDDRFISSEWIERNTKLRHFRYSCDADGQVHLWL